MSLFEIVMARGITVLIFIAFAVCTAVTVVLYKATELAETELPNLIYRKSHKTCSTSWMVWLKENVNPEYCIVASYGSTHALKRVRENLNECGRDVPIAIVDHNDITKSELRKYNSRRTVIFDSIRDPATRVLSLCKQTIRSREDLKGDERCLTESSEEFLWYTYPPNGTKTKDNIIDFYVDCNDVENSICRIRRLIPGAIQEKVTRMRKFNERHNDMNLRLGGGAFENLRNIIDEYINSKLKNGLSDKGTKTRKCWVKYKKNLSKAQYSRYGRESEADKKTVQALPS